MRSVNLGLKQHKQQQPWKVITEQSMISMDQAYLQALGANQRASDRTGIKPTDPYMPSYPDAPMFVDPYGESA